MREKIRKNRTLPGSDPEGDPEGAPKRAGAPHVRGGLTDLGGERCSPSLRDAFGASAWHLRCIGGHMGLCRDRRHQTLNTKNPRHCRDGGLLYLGA